jgi:hypothetical protein
MCSHNASGVRQLGRAFLWSSVISATPVGENCSLQNTINTAYWDMLYAESIWTIDAS